MCSKKRYITGLLHKMREEGTGYNVSWKSCLSSYKSHITKSVHSYKIAKPFIEKSNEPVVPLKYLPFVIKFPGCLYKH